ncbi:DegT/DnrJ/EryC1/StrS family aminotransferase [Desertimonas flava]|uniref:DegT/DnrJ/EryC1/StrS family aminotransferase n=1 Tax=Desertimonas flava TaxID=2064846 RepID=UPI0023E255CF|nr:aminotransferase class I/II-fold pyridoxal phosphate-dependent enzyme [Desertimonas flava]
MYLSAPDVGPLERDYLLRAFDSGWIAPAGPDLTAFESDIAAITGWPGAVALSSGTAALHLALLGCGVGPGDDVLVSTFTFAASANAINYCGANPVFVDSDATSWNMSAALLAEAIDRGRRAGRLPKAAVVVDLYGQTADYDAIAPLLAEHGIALIEDAAEALGATYKDRPAGALGDVGVFSFNGNKIMTTSGGGVFVSPDADAADRVRYLATQARQPAVHYEHTDIGFNYRLSNLLAALGRAQLERLPQMSKRRLEINQQYRDVLSDVDGLTFMPVPEWSGWNGWLTCVVLDDTTTRDAIVAALDAADIESRPLWKPMHLQPVFAGAPVVEDGTSQDLFEHGLCLPSGSILSESDVARVADIVASTVRSRP